ncbi:MAG: hypothetical protein KAU38_01805 [Desulfobacterales bacterium]|nr:hypothetical protein [Desulfobacterales bacterium]
MKKQSTIPGPDLTYGGSSLFQSGRTPGPDRDDTNDTSVQGCRARAGRAGVNRQSKKVTLKVHPVK